MFKGNKIILWLMLAFGAFAFIFFGRPVLASTTTTGSINVSATVESCGDGTINGSELCDNGLSNGACPAQCSASCNFNSCGGGGGGPVDTDTTPPTISNVVSAPLIQGANITWTVNDDKGVSNVAFVYGLNTSYGQAGAISGTYAVSLAELNINTKYYYKISATDTSNNQSVFTGSFTTLSTDSMPPVISNIKVVASFTTAQITFDTDEPATTMIKYGETNAYGAIVNGAQNLSNVHSISLTSLLPNTTYHFQIVAVDAAPYLNSASSLDQIFITPKDNDSPPNVANLKLVATESTILLSWNNPSLNSVPDFKGVRVLRKANTPASGTNDPGAVVKYTGSGEEFVDSSAVPKTTYYYTVYSFDTSENYSPGVVVNGKMASAEPKTEICDNGADDDNNGKADCMDNVCFSAVNCKTTPPVVATTTPSSATTSTPIIPTVPGFVQIKLSDLIFQTSNKKITLTPSGDLVTGLTGNELSVGIKLNALISKPKKIILRIGSAENQFILIEGIYYTEIVFPNIGTTQTYLEVDYGDGQLDSVGFRLNGLPYAIVQDEAGALANARIILYQENGNIFDGLEYNQFNPWNTGSDGGYGWMVPDGKYYLIVNKDGYYSYKSSVFTAQNNVVGQNVNLIKTPLKILEVIDPNASLQKNVRSVSKNIFDKGTAISKITVQNIIDVVASIEEIKNDPEVQKAATGVAPAVVGVVAASTVAAVSWLDLLSLLRFLFLQPLFLLGRKKREKWGAVYNSLTKLPVDLVIVRIFNTETNRLVQSRVTDAQGRYSFVVDPGTYRLEVKKNNFIFPSLLLKDWKTDGEKMDIYHGEPISVTANSSLIAANIPLDPLGEKRTPKRLLRERFWRRTQWGASIFGLIVTVFSLYISPKWYMWALLAVHIGLLGIFRKLALPKKNKGWGIVYDIETKKPISKVVARLFDSHFNKLVAMEVTDRSGRYNFLAGDNKYYVTYERSDYETNKTEEVDLGATKDDIIARDIGLKKKK